MINKLLKNKAICFLTVLIMAATTLHTNKSMATETSSNKDIEVYYFYFEPFGYTCSHIEKYTKDILSKKFKEISFKLVDVYTTAPESLVKGYSNKEKALVIFNKKTNKFVVSSMRKLLKYGFSKEDVQDKFVTELISIM
ncbi:MAG: hypothetical protein GY793_03465 [Proteobacteria bacterium]|nr:hypothetical protein [Pseudomonadota bacterium]